MYSCGLISKSVRDSPTVNSAIDEFENGMQYKDDVLKLQEHCRFFLRCLSIEGGPMNLAAQELCKNWTEQANIKCSVSLDLLCDDIVHESNQGQY